MIFSVMSYITKIMFYIRCYPNDTTMVMNRRHERGLFLRPTMPNAILGLYTNNYISIGLATNFSTSQLLYCLIAFCQYPVNECVMLCNLH